MVGYPLDILDKGSTVKEQWEGRSMPGCWDLGRGTDRESPRAAGRREGRAAVGFEEKLLKVHQWEHRDTEQIPSEQPGMGAETQQDGKAAPRKCLESKINCSSQGEINPQQPALFTLITKIKM